MTLIIGLVATAFLLFFLEIFTPGGILALLGAILILLASVLAYGEWGFFPAVLIFLFGLVGAVVMFFIEIRFLSRTPLGKQLSLQSTISNSLTSWAGDDLSGTGEKLVGSEGVTLTTLAPGGKVQVNGKIYTAAAEDGYLEKGAPIRVLRNETFKLIVQRK